MKCKKCVDYLREYKNDSNCWHCNNGSEFHELIRVIDVIKNEM